MAFDDIQGRGVSVSTGESAAMGAINEDFLTPLRNLMPRGFLWNRVDGSELTNFLRALSYSFTWVVRRGLNLIDEADPRTTRELLEDWERAVDLPGENPTPATEFEDRRNAVVAKLRGYGSPTPTLFEEIADGVGYDATINSTPFDPFVPGSAAGDSLTQSEWNYVWTLRCLGATADETLKYLVGLRTPQHTQCLFYIAKATWDSYNSQISGVYITKVAYGAATFVAVAQSGYLSSSPDGETWTAQTSSFGSSNIEDVLFAAEHDLFVAVGASGKLATSPDGVNWTQRTSGFGSTGITTVFYKYSEGLLAVGLSGKISTSSDGVSWSAQAAAGAYTGTFNTATYGRNLYVIAGANGELQTSPDGATWTAQTSQFGSSGINDLAYGNGVLVAVGDNGKLSTSADGVTWASQTSGFGSSAITKIVFGDDRFVAVGYGGKIATSTDGSVWTLVETVTQHLFDVVFVNGLFVACGFSASLYVSQNGVDWYSRTSGAAANFLTAASGGNAIVCAGAGGSGGLVKTIYGEL